MLDPGQADGPGDPRAITTKKKSPAEARSPRSDPTGAPLTWAEVRTRLGFPPRAEQDAAFAALAAAWAQGRQVTPLEAATGIGKSALVAVLIGAGPERVVYAASTRALQDQLVAGMVPLMVSAGLIADDEVAVLKGRANYLCRRRAWADREELDRRFPTLRARLERDGWTATDFPDVTPEEWAAVCSDGEDGGCGKQECGPEQDGYEAAKEAAHQARLVVTNTAILGYDLLARSMPGVSDDGDEGADALVGPLKGARLVLDEAHHLADVMSDVLGFTVGWRTFSRLARRFEREEERHEERAATKGYEYRQVVPDGVNDRLRDLSARWRPVLSAAAREPTDAKRLAAVIPLVEPTMWELEGLGRLVLRSSGPPGHNAVAASAADRLGKLETRVSKITDRLGTDYVSTVGDANKVEVRQLDVSAESRGLLDLYELAVPMSATLGTAALARAGLAGEEVITAASPFNLRSRRGAFVTAASSSDRQDWSREELAGLVHAARGGALVLTPSHDMKDEAVKVLQSQGLAVGVQGKGSTSIPALVADLRVGVVDVIVGTKGAAEGVDIPGQALRLVVLLAWPNPNPAEPYNAAMAAALGDRAWPDLFEPMGTDTARQAVGRLIRSDACFGVVAFLDPRNSSKSRARTVAAPSRVTSDVGLVRAFFDRELGVEA